MVLGLKVILDKSITVGRVRYVKEITNLKESAMKFETRYNIGDEVYVMSDDKPTKGKVKWIDIHIGRLGKEQIIEVRYQVLSYDTPYSEGLVFPSKEELLKSL